MPSWIGLVYTKANTEETMYDEKIIILPRWWEEYVKYEFFGLYS